ncbi:hypothetical protein BV25DRAFT_1910350 [Artomyces pyxidatus]|uniref:Uncharacterized protein n=1 Tax=Artomyces pyxidatus TaxID=48021 RepID=A0ACB8TJM3_9AGAM|nr:hypothetical protein BV25DRAFT_1910350 [Artomyces pyxidatus]
MDGQYIDRKDAAKSYRPKGYVMSPGLMRAREPYRVRNAVTGVVISAFAVGAWLYSMNAVKQDNFDDVDEEARALMGSGMKSLEDQAREREAAKRLAAVEPAQAVRPPSKEVSRSVGSSNSRGLLQQLDGAFPRLLEPKKKTLVWFAPSVDAVGKMGDRTSRG